MIKNNAAYALRSIALSKIMNNHYHFNIGEWMGCKIYSDVRGNACECGGSFTSYHTIKKKSGEITYPVCSNCGVTPDRFRIRAKLKDVHGKSKYVFIRNNIAGQKMTDIDDVMGVLSKIQIDSDAGRFKASDYDKKSVQDSYLFKNVVDAYLKFNGPRVQRKELSPYSLESKKKYSALLVKYFSSYPIHEIEAHHIMDFKNTLESFSNQSMCLGEMKTILNWAAERYKLPRVPKFEVPSSKKRKSVPDLDITRDKIIPAIDNDVHREAIRMLEHYGLRPSEVRAIQYEQIDLVNDRIKIDRHFSKTTLLMGRKSASEGEDTANLDRPLSDELKSFIKSRPWPLNKKTFLFTNSVGKALGVKDLSVTWKKTLKKLKLPHVEMYGLRGAKITEVLKQSGGNMVEARDFAGHTDIKTTMGRYDHSDRNVDHLFKKTK